MSNERCGLRLIDSIRANAANDSDAEARARADVWKRYKVQLAHVTCGWEPGHKGKCMWRWAMTWWRPGIDPATPDPETDALIGAELRRTVTGRRRAQSVLGLVGALAAPAPREPRPPVIRQVAGMTVVDETHNAKMAYALMRYLADGGKGGKP